MNIRSHRILLGAFLCVVTTLNSTGLPGVQSRKGPHRPPADPTTAGLSEHTKNLSDPYQKLPMIFEENRGQANDDVRFIGRAAGFALLLKHDEVVLSPTASSNSNHQTNSDSTAGSNQLRMRLEGANPNPSLFGSQARSTRANYFIGNDRTKWIRNIETYSQVSYSNIYGGIDLTFYGNPQQLEYDFTIAAGADPRDIRLKFDDAHDISLNADGTLMLRSATDEITQNPPFAYQDIDGTRIPIAASFKRLSGGEIGFDIGSYDQRHPLVIDPVLVYATYLGGNAADAGRGLVVTSNGDLLIVGDSFSSNFLRNATPDNSDIFIGKLAKNGLLLTYTFFGGAKNDTATGLAVDATGNLYLAGTTESPDFPIFNAIGQALFGSSDAFVVKLTPAADQFFYSTLVGGSGTETAVSIAGDPAGNAYVTGRTTSTDFPIVGPLQAAYGGGDSDAFVTKLAPDGNSFTYSTYLGGSGAENTAGRTGIAVDAAGVAYVVGDSVSSDFPLKNALRGTKTGSASSTDGFIAKINANGSDFVYSTLLGGSEDDFALGVATDASANAYVTGRTKSTSFTGSSATRSTSSTSDAFVAKLNSAGAALTYLTFIGGATGNDSGNAIVVDSSGNAVIAGDAGEGLVTVKAVQSFSRGSGDALVAKLSSTGAVTFSTYLGGSNRESALAVGINSAGVIHITGTTDSTDLPTVDPLVKTNSGQTDILIAKIDPNSNPDRPLLIQAVISGKNLILYGQGFESGAVLRVNDEQVKTRNDEPDPSQVLFAKKAAKRIGAGETVQLQVENPNGQRSNFLFFTKPQ